MGSVRYWSSLLLRLGAALMMVLAISLFESFQQPQGLSPSTPEKEDIFPQAKPRSVEEAVQFFATKPKPTLIFHNDAKFQTQAYINYSLMSNINAIFSGPWMFASGNLNAFNSTIIFKGPVQFFSTQTCTQLYCGGNLFYLDSSSTWTFEDTVNIMSNTQWVGTGFIYLPPRSVMTVHSSNTLKVSVTTLFEGLVTIADLITMLEILGPSKNTGTIVSQGRTSRYVCSTSTDIGRCELDGVTMTTMATYLTYWRIVDQLQVWGGIMYITGGAISAQLNLPFDLEYSATPTYSVLDLVNVSRTVVLCGVLFGTTVTSITTVIVLDTSCTYAGEPSFSNYAAPFVPSDGWIINWGTVIFANVTSKTKALYIANGVFEIYGQGMYIDVETNSTVPFTVALMYYNSTSCILDWTIYERIVNCPAGAVCRTSGESLGEDRCVYWFHLNDYNPSDEALWWLLLLLIIPYCCCCCLLWHYWGVYRKRRDEKRRAMRHDADLTYGKDQDVPLTMAIPGAAGATGTGMGCAAAEGTGCLSPEGCVFDDENVLDETRIAPSVFRPNTSRDPGVGMGMQPPPQQSTSAAAKVV
jgi:hypothetical protein